MKPAESLRCPLGMRTALSLLLVAAFTTSAAEEPHYLTTLHERWAVADLVCIGDASAPKRTGLIETIAGAPRDQLSAVVEIETCLKGTSPQGSRIRLLGNDFRVVTSPDEGVLYAGPPVGFVSEGRNLLFLRPTPLPDEFIVAVPVFERAIRLADQRPDQAGASSAHSVLTAEFEAALAQFADDTRYIDYLLDLLPARDGLAELTRLLDIASLPVRQDIAVALLLHDQRDSEPAVIALLLDSEAQFWKREKAAVALADHGSEAGFGPLEQIAGQTASTDELRELREAVLSSLQRLRNRLQAAQPAIP